MKTILTQVISSLIFILLSVVCVAQAPQSFSYQAVARDNAGNIIANQNISIRFSIRDVTSAGTIVYQETQNTTSNSLGLCNLSVGQGTVVSGVFSNIDWGNGAKFLEVEIDPTGGSSYTAMGVTQMLSVPYALYAANAGGATGNALQGSVFEADGTGYLTIGSGSGFVLIPGLSSTIDLADSSILNVHTIGGFTNSGGINAYVVVDIAIYVDGVNAGTPGYQRIANMNGPTLTGVPTHWSIIKSFVVGPGTHTVEVKASWVQASGGAITAGVSSPPGFIGHGEVLTTVIKK